MQHSEETYHILRKELETQILEKLRQIEAKVKKDMTSHSENIQILISVSDELDDVLLNWQTGSISALQFDLDDD